MRVLGIDPGIERVGWGVVDVEHKNLSYKNCGCIKTPRTASQQQRISQIIEALTSIIDVERPECAVVEKLFFAKNKKTALAVSEARGAILAALDQSHIPTHERTPLEVKMALTGNGRAEKHQVAWIVKNILKMEESVTSDDALDALALCLVVGNTITS